MLNRILKVFFSLASAGFFALGTISAIAGEWNTAVLLGLAAIVCGLWEIATGLDILISENDA